MLYASSLSQRKPIQSQQEGHRWSSARAPERTSELLNKGIEEQQQRNEQHHSNRFCSLSFLFYSYFSFISLHPSLLFLLCKTMCFPLYLYYVFFKKQQETCEEKSAALLQHFTVTGILLRSSFITLDAEDGDNGSLVSG